MDKQSALAGSAWARDQTRQPQLLCDSSILWKKTLLRPQTRFRNAPMNLLALLVLLSADGMGAGVEVAFLPWLQFLGGFPAEISDWISISILVLMPVINYQRKYSIDASNATDVVRAQTHTKHSQKISKQLFLWVLLVVLVVESLEHWNTEITISFYCSAAIRWRQHLHSGESSITASFCNFSSLEALSFSQL